MNLYPAVQELDQIAQAVEILLRELRRDVDGVEWFPGRLHSPKGKLTVLGRVSRAPGPERPNSDAPNKGEGQ